VVAIDRRKYCLLRGMAESRDENVITTNIKGLSDSSLSDRYALDLWLRSIAGDPDCFVSARVLLN
jgi:hypothetical protein